MLAFSVHAHRTILARPLKVFGAGVWRRPRRPSLWALAASFLYSMFGRAHASKADRYSRRRLRQDGGKTLQLKDLLRRTGLSHNVTSPRSAAASMKMPLKARALPRDDGPPAASVSCDTMPLAPCQLRLCLMTLRNCRGPQGSGFEARCLHKFAPQTIGRSRSLMMTPSPMCSTKTTGNPCRVQNYKM